MVVHDVEIINVRGMHARAAAKFVQIAGRFESQIRISRDGVQVDGKSILGLLQLAATRGSTVKLTVDGTDETEAARCLTELIRDRFGEDE